MSHTFRRILPAWRRCLAAVAPAMAAFAAGCNDSTEPTQQLAASYILSTIDANPVPYVYATSGTADFGQNSRYVSRTLKQIASDSFVISEVLDYRDRATNESFGYQCAAYDAEVTQSGRYVIFKYYVRDPTPMAPSVGGMGLPVVMVAKYDTLQFDGQSLVQATEAIPGRVSRLVFTPGVATETCPTT